MLMKAFDTNFNPCYKLYAISWWEGVRYKGLLPISVHRAVMGRVGPACRPSCNPQDRIDSKERPRKRLGEPYEHPRLTAIKITSDCFQIAWAVWIAVARLRVKLLASTRTRRRSGRIVSVTRTHNGFTRNYLHRSLHARCTAARSCNWNRQASGTSFP